MPSPSEGSAPKDKSKLSREEREAKYKSVRDRIFGDMPESSTTDVSSTGDTSAAISRSSSASGKKKSYKQRTPKDDSFEARSQFNAWYPTVTFPSAQQPSSDTNTPHSNFQQGPFAIPPISATYPITYGPNPTHTYVSNGFDPNGPFPNGYLPGPPVPQFEFREGWSGQQSSNNPVYFNYSHNNQNMHGPSPQPPTAQSSGFNQFGQPVGSQMSNPQPTWMQQPYQPAYPQPAPYPQTTSTAWPGVPSQLNTTPQYSYNQYPPQPINGAQYSSPPPAHPSSFQSSPFNPQTRSFVPASSTRPTSRNVQNQPMYVKSIDDLATSNTPFSTFRQPPSFSSSPQLSPGQHIAGAQPNSSGALTSPGQEESIQKKWGTPSHLPKKPPPSEVPSPYDIDKTGSLPSQKSYPSIVASGSKSNGPLVVSGGTGFPMMS